MPESTSQLANKKGYTYAGFGYWKNKAGKVVARTQNGRLVPVTSKTATPKSTPSATKSTNGTTAVDGATIMGQKVGAQAGSNPGGFYMGKDGVKRYVKQYKEASKAHSEKLANDIYNDLGIRAPKSHVFDLNGKTMYASDIVANKGELNKLSGSARKAAAREILNGFLADILLANWDAVGLNDDNIVIGNDGKPVRIDNGGSLMFRAQAGRKPNQVLTGIPEWEGFWDEDINPSYSKLFRQAGYDSPQDMKPTLINQLKKILDVQKRSGGWQKYVDQHAPDMNDSDKKIAAQMLDARTKKLINRIKEL